MNLDEVADQHAWITVDSKSQVWIANSSEGKELKVNTRPIPPGGKPMMLHHNSIIFIEGRAFRFEEESCLQDKAGSDAESPSENIVVDNSPVKEKRAVSTSVDQQNPGSKSEQAAPSPGARTKHSSGNDRSSNGDNSAAGPKVGTKRTLAQSFDHVESSPSKRQRTDAPVSRSAEILPSNSTGKLKLSTVREEKPADLPVQTSPTKTNPLHKVRFLLPGQSSEVRKPLSSHYNGDEPGSHSSMSAPTSPVKSKSASTRVQNFDDSQSESNAIWMRKMKKKLDEDDEEDDDGNGITSSELDRISKTSSAKRGAKSPKKEPKKGGKEKKKTSTPSTSPKKRARSPSPDSRSSSEDSEEEERKSKSSKKKSSSKDKKKDKKISKDKDSLQSKIRNIESSTIKSKSNKKHRASDSDDEDNKKSKSKHKSSNKSKSPEKDRNQKKRSLRVRRSKKKVSLSSDESNSSEEYDFNSEKEESISEEESNGSASSSDDFQESPKKTKSSSPKKRKAKESLESVSSEESSGEEKHKSKNKKRKLQVEPVKPKKVVTPNHSPTKTKKKKGPSSDNESDVSGEVNESRHSEEENSRKEAKDSHRESFKAFLKPMAHKKPPTEVVAMHDDEEKLLEETDVPTSFPPNRPKTAQTYYKKDRNENSPKDSTINLAPIKSHKPADLLEEVEEQIEASEPIEEGGDDVSAFFRVAKKVTFNAKPPSPIPLDSPSGSFSPSAQTIPSFLETQNNGKSFVFVHGLPSQMTQRQSLYSPQLSQSPSSDQEGHAGANKDEVVAGHVDEAEKMEVEPQEAAEIRSTPVPRQSQQGASMSLFSDVKEDEEPMNNDGNNREDKDRMEENDEDQSTLVVDRGDKGQHVEEEPNINTREQSLTKLMEASTLIVDAVPEAPLQRQGSRSLSKSKSSDSVNTCLMSHDGNINSATTNPWSMGSRSSNTTKLDDTHTTSTTIGAQTSAVSSYESLSIEEKIEPKMKAEEISSVDDLQKRIVVTFHDLGSDEPQLLDDVIKAASELLPENYLANTPNYQNELASAMMPLVSHIIISDVQYYKLNAQYRKSKQTNEREHEQFDEQEEQEEQNEQLPEANFSFIPVKSTSLNAHNTNGNSISRSPSIPPQSIQSYESDQIANVASIPINAAGKMSQLFEEHDEEPRDQANEGVAANDEQSVHENDEDEPGQQPEKKVASQNMRQSGFRIVNYGNGESANNKNSADQEPRPSPSDEENSDQAEEKQQNSEKIVSQRRVSQRELETQHYSQNSRKSANHSQNSRGESQNSQPKLNESGSKVRSLPDQLRMELNKGMEILKSIVAKQKEPNAIRKWKRDLNIQLRGNYLLCGGLKNNEVRILLQLLLDELPNVNLEFIVSKLFSTAVVTIMIARNPKAPHDEVMQQVGQRCVALKVVGDDVANWQLADVLNKEG
jgi:hypothetical protein